VEADRPHAHIFIFLQFGPWPLLLLWKRTRLSLCPESFTMSALLSVFCFGGNSRIWDGGGGGGGGGGVGGRERGGDGVGGSASNTSQRR
jgi:hypothetical protein